MPKPPANHGKQWTPSDEAKLDKLIAQNTPTPLIAYRLERTEDAVRSHVQDTDRSLAPTNKSPYNRQNMG